MKMIHKTQKKHEKKLIKVFARGPGGQFFQKAPPWPPEAKN
jgi:hypothetical protein